jgi:hypothetical protein
MTDPKIEDKKAQIQALRAQAEQETAWLEKNRLLYTEKRARLDSLIEERGTSGGEVIPEEQKLSTHVAIYESRRSGVWDLAREINQEEQNLKAMT